jgi:hypothetical protein
MKQGALPIYQKKKGWSGACVLSPNYGYTFLALLSSYPGTPIWRFGSSNWVRTVGDSLTQPVLLHPYRFSGERAHPLHRCFRRSGNVVCHQILHSAIDQGE